MQLTVMIPCYNGAATIAEQLEALARQEWDGDWEVVVSDNGSTDETREIVQGFSDRVPNLRIVDSSNIRGIANARNVAVRETRSPWLLTCDADDVVADNYVAAMAEAFGDHDFIACRLDVQRLNEPWLIESWPCGQESSLPDFSPSFLPSGAGASLGFKRHVFDKVGGFDPDPKIWGREDNDFCWRVQLAGIPLHFVAETAIYYRYPTAYSRMFQQSRFLARSSVQLYKRYQPFGMPRLPRRKALRGRVRWKRILAQLRHLKRADRVQRARFVRDLGHKVGRVEGSIRYRVLAF